MKNVGRALQDEGYGTGGDIGPFFDQVVDEVMFVTYEVDIVVNKNEDNTHSGVCVVDTNIYHI